MKDRVLCDSNAGLSQRSESATDGDERLDVCLRRAKDTIKCQVRSIHLMSVASVVPLDQGPIEKELWNSVRLGKTHTTSRGVCRPSQLAATLVYNIHPDIAAHSTIFTSGLRTACKKEQRALRDSRAGLSQSRMRICCRTR
jgi:hypothetical protein